MYTMYIALLSNNIYYYDLVYRHKGGFSNTMLYQPTCILINMKAQHLLMITEMNVVCGIPPEILTVKKAASASLMEYSIDV